jgi:hypothetical protein
MSVGAAAMVTMDKPPKNIRRRFFMERRWFDPDDRHRLDIQPRF